MYTSAMADHKPKVLYIEDEPFFARTVTRLLTECGYEAMSAQDGEQGLALAQSEAPGLILLDLILPKMQGKDVLKALKADAATKDIPVIALSNLSEEAETAEMKQLGAVEYLVKATTLPSEIVTHVKAHLPMAA